MRIKNSDMIKKFLGRYVLGLMLLLCCMPVKSQEIVHVIFEDNYTLGRTAMDMTHEAKKRRTQSANRGVISFSYDSINDKDRSAIEAAATIWSSYLANGDTVKIDIVYDNTMACDIKTDVLYYKNGDTAYPSSLAKHLFLYDNPIHAIISINGCCDWDVDSENGGVSKKNLTYAMLRSIAQVMGFGGSIKRGNHNEITTGIRNCYSLFDKIILFSDGSYMKEIPLSNSNNEELSSFVQPSCGFLYVKEVNQDNMLYAPSSFDDGKSLKFLMNTSSLMNYEEAYSWGTEIDSLTIDLLNEIGWHLKKTAGEIRIKGTGIDDNGIASAYTSHHFYIFPTAATVSNPHWEYKLPLKDGGFQTVLTSNDNEFTTPSVSNENLYLHDSEGDIHAKILFTGIVNGQSVSLEYNLSLELKPRIVKLEYTDLTPSDGNPTYYDVLVNVIYEGAYYVYATVREEYASSATAYSSYTPYYASIRMNTISGVGNATVKVKVQNEYGTTTKTIIIPQQYSVDDGDRAPTDIQVYNHYDDIQVYNYDGDLIGHIHQISDLEKMDLRGFFYLRYFENGQYVKSIKIYK
ncbi:MAG: hypothetical protein J6M94_00345 [Prevotella sp.]|nr:hypothetical protein [Prevotella sp.]